MEKTILITGSTDGIGLETAKKMASMGHNVLLHGRNVEKLAQAQEELRSISSSTIVESYAADLSKLSEVETMVNLIKKKHAHLDILINNAGVLKTNQTRTGSGFDVRFMVNTIAPYYLTQKLLPLMKDQGRIINLSSAAQAPVDIEALLGKVELTDYDAYAQSKLAITMWSFHLAQKLKNNGPTVIAVNPGSLLGSKMVKEAFGTPGKDIGIGVKILTALSFDSEYQNASGKYFDNDLGALTAPHPHGLDEQRIEEVVRTIKGILSEKLTS